MAEKSKIEWTDHTHNEWIGCEKVSQGCKFCYAENLMDKRYGKAKWGANGTRTLTSVQNRNKPFSWNRKAEKEGVRYRVFAQSLSDTFEDRDELAPWRLELFEKIKATPNLDWLVLTKRPEVAKVFFETYPEYSNLPNVWLGVSVEDQGTAHERIPVLLSIPAKVRFLSCEPLLGNINFTKTVLDRWARGNHLNYLSGVLEKPSGLKIISPDFMGAKIDWCIVGGESGHNARKTHPDWVRSIQKQCEEANVAFFFKQWGEYCPVENFPDEEGDNWTPQNGDVLGCYVANQDKINGVYFSKVGKHKAGRLLDGKEYSEYPTLNKQSDD